MSAPPQAILRRIQACEPFYDHAAWEVCACDPRGAGLMLTLLPGGCARCGAPHGVSVFVQEAHITTWVGPDRAA
jgi:hypothetical protein